MPWKGASKRIKFSNKIVFSIFFNGSLVFCCLSAIESHRKKCVALNCNPIHRPTDRLKKKKQKGASGQRISNRNFSFYFLREFIAHRIVYSSFIDRKNRFGVPIEQPPVYVEDYYYYLYYIHTSYSAIYCRLLCLVYQIAPLHFNAFETIKIVLIFKFLWSPKVTKLAVKMRSWSIIPSAHTDT